MHRRACFQFVSVPATRPEKATTATRPHRASGRAAAPTVSDLARLNLTADDRAGKPIKPGPRGGRGVRAALEVGGETVSNNVFGQAICSLVRSGPSRPSSVANLAGAGRTPALGAGPRIQVRSRCRRCLGCRIRCSLGKETNGPTPHGHRALGLAGTAASTRSEHPSAERQDRSSTTTTQRVQHAVPCARGTAFTRAALSASKRVDAVARTSSEAGICCCAEDESAPQ